MALSSLLVFSGYVSHVFFERLKTGEKKFFGFLLSFYGLRAISRHWSTLSPEGIHAIISGSLKGCRWGFKRKHTIFIMYLIRFRKFNINDSRLKISRDRITILIESRKASNESSSKTAVWKKYITQHDQ